MDHKVESFPFNVTSQPMYLGSTLNFLATALWCVEAARPPLCRVYLGSG